MDQQAVSESSAAPPSSDALPVETAVRLHSDLGELPLLIPIPRVAKILGISRSAAYRCAASGELPTTHLGGRVYVVTRRLQELLESA